MPARLCVVRRVQYKIYKRRLLKRKFATRAVTPRLPNRILPYLIYHDKCRFAISTGVMLLLRPRAYQHYNVRCYLDDVKHDTFDYGYVGEEEVTHRIVNLLQHASNENKPSRGAAPGQVAPHLDTTRPCSFDTAERASGLRRWVRDESNTAART